MNITKWIGAVLLALGTLALVYGGFSYTEKETALKVGPVEVDVEQQHRVNVPMWGGVAAIVIGGALLLVRLPRR
jgi:hypothetical protein